MATVLNLNGSAISLYHSFYGLGGSEKTLVGQAHWIRADEWAAQTPDILNQTLRLHPFRVQNSHLGAHSVSLFGNIPVAHITTLFRPQFWSFFFLPVEYAYAAYWQFKALILLTGVFTWLLLLTGSTLWSVTGSLWFFFSPCTQWAYSWLSSLPEMIGSICFATVFACYLTVGASRRALSLAALGFSTCAINFGLCSYLPHMIPFAWLSALVLGGWCIANRTKLLEKDELRTWRIAWAAAAIGLIAIMGALVYYQGRTAIRGIADTSYPGRRIFPGGTLSLPFFLGHFFGWFGDEQHFPPGTTNICEAAGFLWLGPVTLFCLGMLKLTHLKRTLLVALSCGFALLLAWSLMPCPQWFGTLLALGRTGGTRVIPALGFVNVSVAVLAMSAFCDEARRKIRSSLLAVVRRSAGVLLVVAMLLVLTDYIFAWAFHWKQMTIAISFTALLVTLMIHGSKRLLPVLLVIPSLLAFGMVNPVERGLGVITSSSMFKFIRTNPDYLAAKWVIFSDGVWMPGFLAAMGCQVYGGVHYLPDVDHFGLFASRGLDVNAFNQAGALMIQPILPSDRTSVKAIQAGFVMWKVAPTDPLLKQVGVKYIAFDRKPADTIAAGLVPLAPQPIDKCWLYRIP